MDKRATLASDVDSALIGTVAQKRDNLTIPAPVRTRQPLTLVRLPQPTTITLALILSIESCDNTLSCTPSCPRTNDPNECVPLQQLQQQLSRLCVSLLLTERAAQDPQWFLLPKAPPSSLTPAAPPQTPEEATTAATKADASSMEVATDE